MTILDDIKVKDDFKVKDGVEADTVDAGYRHFFGEQAGDDQRTELVARAHQNQDIFWLQRPVFSVQPKRIIRRQPLFDLHRKLLGKDSFLFAGP